MNKVISYIGYAIKSRKIIVGQSLIKRSKDSIYCILVDVSASNNLIDLAKNVANKHSCTSIIVENLEFLTHIKDIKIIAITDESLGRAIVDNKEIISIG